MQLVTSPGRRQYLIAPARTRRRETYLCPIPPRHPTPAWNTRDGTRQVRCGPLIARHSQQEFQLAHLSQRAKTTGQTLGHISAPTLSIKKRRRRSLSTSRQKKKLSIVYTVMPHAALYSRCSLPNKPRTGHLRGWYICGEQTSTPPVAACPYHIVVLGNST